jgi:mitochondrial import inner membrane translocase subunit TIM17
MNTVPCPGRIIIDLGDGFSTGCALGALWYFVKGSYYAVRRERIKGGLMLLRSRAPILGGSFAMWACIFSVSSCIMVYIRQREDPINSVIAGFSTGFVLAIRGGFRNAFRSAVIGGLFLGIIEGIMVIHQQWQKRKQIVEENKMITKYRREMEKQYGYKFKEPIKMNPYDPNRKIKSFKADVVGASDVIISDPAQKLI